MNHAVSNDRRNKRCPRHWASWTALLLWLCVAAFSAAAQDTAQPALNDGDDGQHLMHSHEPLILDATVAWPDLIENTLARFPTHFELEAHQAEADALVDTGSRWFSAAPALYFSYLSDAPLDDLDQREYEVGVELSLWRSGQRRAARGLGESASAEATAARDALRWEISGLLRTRLWNIASASNAVVLAKESVSIAAELLRAVQRRREAGDLPISDELLAQSAMLEKQVILIDAEAEVLDAERAYRSLTGLDERPVSFSEVQTQRADFDASHPMLALASAEVERARASVAVAEKGTRGAPRMSIGPHRQRDPLGTSYSNSLTLAVTMPLGGKRYGTAEQAQAVRKVAEAESQHAMLLRELDLELHEAEHNLFVVDQSLEVAMQYAELAERQWQMGETAFAQGEIDLRDLLRIQESAQTAKRNVARFEIERQRSVAMINQALGEVP